MKDNPISRETFSVEEELFIDIAIEIKHVYDKISRGAVLSISLLDHKGSELKFNIPGMNSSKNFKNYKYLEVGSKKNPSRELASVIIPPGAINAVVEVFPWDESLVRPSAEIILLPSGQLLEFSPMKSGFSFSRPISPIWKYYLNIQAKSVMDSTDKCVLQIQYYTSNGKEVTPRREEYLHWSKNLNSHYRYVGTGESNFHTTDHEMSPPVGSEYCIITISCETKFIARFLGPMESSINWSHPNRSQIRNELKRTELEATRKSITSISDKLSTSQGHSAISYEASIQRGELNSALSHAKDSCKDRPGERSLHRMRYISELVETLDPDWLPTMGPIIEDYKPIEKRILHLFKVNYPYESTGGAIRNMNVVKCQKEIGWDPVVITPLGYPRSHGFSEAKQKISVHGIDHHHLDLGPLPSQILRYPAKHIEFNAQILQKYIRDLKPSLIHAASGYRGFELAVMAMSLSKQTGIPWVYEVRSFHEQTWTRDRQYAADSERTKMREIRENSLMKEADAVVTISESMASALAERGVPREKITVVPNAVYPEEFSLKKKKKTLAKSLGITNKFVIGYVSNISLREGHDVLIESFSSLAEEFPDTILLLVGDGPERNSLERRVTDYGLEDRVIFTGEVDHSEVKDYYRMIDLFVIPRRRDYAADLVTPMKPYEAMSLGIPLIVSDREALMEVIGRDRGFFFATEDPDDLSRVMKNCMDRYPDCIKKAKEARKWIEEHRSWKRNSVIYDNLYRNLLSLE